MCVGVEQNRNGKVDLTANIYTDLSADNTRVAVEKLGQLRKDKSPFVVGMPQEAEAEFGPVQGPVENAKLANLSDKPAGESEGVESEKSPQNVELSGLFESSPGRARTYDKRINRTNQNPTLSNEKPKSNDSSNLRASTGASEFSCSELQAWIESCPVELEDWQRKAIVALAQDCKLNQKEFDTSAERGEPTESDRRIIRLWD